MSEVALNYLKSIEYSMGNGQCPECYGVPPSWHGHPCHLTPQSIGHKANCSIAQAIISSGGDVIFKNSSSELPLGPRYKKGSALYEYKNSPEYKAWAQKTNKEWDDFLFKIATRGKKIQEKIKRVK